MSFWNKLEKPFFCLAPMEDVTDVVFRSVVLKAGRPDVFFTEFMNTDGFCHPNGRANVAKRLVFELQEGPVVAQIWGSNPQKFAQTSLELVKLGFDGIDINMGCPAKIIVKTGGGSALIEKPELAVKIIQATQRAVQDTGVAISVKTRLGVYQIDEWKPWLTSLLNQQLDALTVHLRTRKEMSKVPAHYELIPEIADLRDRIAPHTKLIINGDVRDRAHGLELSQQHPVVDGWMIGRGVFTNPFCFEKKPRQHSNQDLVDLLEYHLDLFDELGEERLFEPLKRFFKIYINNFSGSKDLREKLMASHSTVEVRDILKEFQNNANNVQLKGIKQR